MPDNRTDKMERLRKEIATMRSEGFGYGDQRLHRLSLELRQLERELEAETKTEKQSQMTASEIVDRIMS